MTVSIMTNGYTFVANWRDSGVVLYRNAMSIPLSDDHKVINIPKHYYFPFIPILKDVCYEIRSYCIHFSLIGKTNEQELKVVELESCLQIEGERLTD